MPPADFGKGYSKLIDTEDTEENEFAYRQFVSSVVHNIQTMSSNVTAIKILVDNIGTSRETPDLIDQIQQKQHATNELAHRIGEDLKTLLRMEAYTQQDQIQRDIRLDKLKNNFSDVLKNFQVTQRLAADKEKASIRLAKETSIANDTAPLIEGFEDTRADIQNQIQQEITLEDISKREQAIRKIEDDIVGVNEIFRDLATMIHEQGEVIDSIEANVEITAQRVENAGNELAKANKIQCEKGQT